MYMYIYTGLEIGGVTSPSANQFWSNCESLWQSESQNCESLICESLFKWCRKKTSIWSSPFLDKTSPFLDTFYVYGAKMRISCEL